MDDYIKITGKKGFTTYKHKDKFLFSNYDPVSEAKKYVASLTKINKYIITCCGLDYVNTELLKNNNIELIISYEPVDFKNNLTDNRIIRVNTSDQIEKILLNNGIHADEITLIFWQPLLETNPSLFINSLKKIKDKIYKSSISGTTEKVFGFLETKNVLLNITLNENLNYLKVFGGKINLPVLLISSGSSLTDNIKFIKNIKDNAVVIALPSALSFLNQYDIYPDYVIAVDPGYATYYHLIGYKKNIKLICPSSINPNVFRLKNYDKILFNYDNYFEKLFFEKTDIVTSPPEGTVFINALRIIKQIGFNDVILIGQDFGYNNGLTHVKSGFFEKELSVKSYYYESLEYKIKKLEESIEKTELKIMNKTIVTNFAFKLYYEHFIEKDFGLNIFLTKNHLNPLSEKIKIIDENFIKNNYKKDTKNILIEEIDNYEKRKKSVINNLENIFKLFNNNKETNFNESILKNTYIDTKNKLHFVKLKKILCNQRSKY